MGGVVGLDPRLFTERQLFWMAESKREDARAIVWAQAVMVWQCDKADGVRWITEGHIGKHPRHEPLKMPPELLEKVQAEQARLREEINDGGPK